MPCQEGVHFVHVHGTKVSKTCQFYIIKTCMSEIRGLGVVIAFVHYCNQSAYDMAVNNYDSDRKFELTDKHTLFYI